MQHQTVTGTSSLRTLKPLSRVSIPTIHEPGATQLTPNRLSPIYSLAWRDQALVPSA